MTEYRVMVKAKHGKHYQCYGHHTESRYADKNAESLARQLWTEKVKVVVDDGCTKEELSYK